jgi:hypothetical protein
MYRVLEWADRKNGMTAITSRSAVIASHDFGKLMAQAGPKRRIRRVNVFELYRRRTLRRLATFRVRGDTDRKIAEHLYGVRCELAHGARTVRLDRTPDVAEVARDLPIVKLLARMVIEP